MNPIHRRGSFVLAGFSLLLLSICMAGCSQSTLFETNDDAPPVVTPDAGSTAIVKPLADFGTPCAADSTRCADTCVDEAWNASPDLGAVVLTMCASLPVDSDCPAGAAMSNDSFCQRLCSDDTGCGIGAICRGGLCSPSCTIEPEACPVEWRECSATGHCAADLADAGAAR